MRVLMPSISAAVLLAVAVVAAPRVGVARAQSMGSGQSTMGGQTGGNRTGSPGRPGSNDPLAETPNPLSAMQEAARVRAVADDRQKKLIDDTAKLLELATELKSEVDKSTKNQLSLEVVRKADEIEKLAHDVKQRMKG